MSALAKQRQHQILEKMRREGAVRVSDLVEEMNVSDMTIRRDIASLADRGLAHRVHGGATLADTSGSSYEPSFASKLGASREEKLAIAQVAASLVPPGSSVAISAGTTALAVAEALLPVRDLTIVTNSVPVAQTMHDPERRDRTLVLTGGVRTPSDALVGSVAVAGLTGLHVDRLFLGVHGISERAGCTSPNIAEVTTNKALIETAAQIVVVADRTKVGLVGLATVISLDEIDVLITDAAMTDEDQTMLAAHVGKVMTAVVAPNEIGNITE